MTCVELNPAGNFSSWDDKKLNEIKLKLFDDDLQEELFFENDFVSLWHISLEPYERIPFTKLDKTISWTALTPGLAISRFTNGKIQLFRFNKGDTGFIESTNENIIADFENIGEETLRLSVLAYKGNYENAVLPPDINSFFKE